MALISDFEEARRRLKSTNLVNGMPGRDTEFKAIYDFLFERLKIRKKTSNKLPSTHINKTIFVCGVPGTGKTATVQMAEHKLRKLLDDPCPKINKFTTIYINGEQLPTPQKLYTEIMFRLTQQQMTPDAAQERLDKWFTTNHDIGNFQKRRETRQSSAMIEDDFKLIIIDELDLLYNDKSQSVFYNLFEWTTSSESKIIVIAIANAIDLPRRFMRGRINSRIGWETVLFSCYTSESLECILRSRLGDLFDKCFAKSAITVATKRIGKTTGDARRILDTCSLAIDLAISQKQKNVDARMIDEVGFQNFDVLKKGFFEACLPISLIILKCILIQIEEVGEEQVVAFEVMREASVMIRKKKEFEKMRYLSVDEFYNHLEYLASPGIIILERSKPLLLGRIYLNDSSDVFRDMIRSAVIVI